MGNLKSDSSTLFDPASPNAARNGRVYPDEAQHGERARTTIGILSSPQLRAVGDKRVICGRDVRRFAEIARTHSDVAIAENVIRATTFWVDGELQSRNDYDAAPGYETLDNLIMAELNQDF